MKCLYLLFFMLVLLSCTKEKGYIPPAELNEPHYEDFTPDLLWQVQCTDENQGDITSMKVYDNRVIVLTYFGFLKVYDLANGNLINEERFDQIFSETIQRFKIRENGNSLYILDESNHQFMQLNKESGQIIDIYTPPDTFSNILLSFGMEVIDQDAYFYKYSASHSYSFIKYNYVTREEEIINDLSSLDLTFSAHQASFYYPALEKFYACSYNDIGQLVIFSIDKDSGELEVLKKLFVLDELQHAMDLIVMDDILIIEISDRLIQGINIHTGDTKWEMESPNNYYLLDVFTHLGQTYLNLGRDLFQINPHNGSIIWGSEYFREESIFDLVPDKNMAVSSVEDKERHGSLTIRRSVDRNTIYDLNTGKRLVEWEIRDPDDDGVVHLRSISYSQSDTSSYIIQATDNYIFKYQWPF